MSEISSSEFIHSRTLTEHFMAMGYEQKLAFLAFYESYCNVAYGESVEHLDDRDGDFPFPVGSVRAGDNTIFGISATFDAHENPADYLVVAAELRDGHMIVNELEVVQIQHVPYGRYEGINKIVNAKWHETSKKVSIRLGHQASITTQDQSGLIVLSAGFAVG